MTELDEVRAELARVNATLAYLRAEVVLWRAQASEATHKLADAMALLAAANIARNALDALPEQLGWEVKK